NRQRRDDRGAVGRLLLSFVEQFEGALASRASPSRSHARVMYSPERVSTFRRSPTFTNSGTCTTTPVASVAGLRAPDTRSPWTPGSVLVTVNSTAAGRSTPT